MLNTETVLKVCLLLVINWTFTPVFVTFWFIFIRPAVLVNRLCIQFNCPFLPFSFLFYFRDDFSNEKKKREKREKRHKGLGILVSIRSARPSMRGFGGQLPGVLYLGNDFKISRNGRGICNFKLLGVIM